MIKVCYTRATSA